MKRIVLFRFHDHFDVCRNRLELLKHFQPDIKIFGLFGGKESEHKKFRKELDLMEDIYCIAGKTDRWKWKNGDLAIREWYNDFGSSVTFDMLHLIEWDLLLLDTLENIYRKIPKNGIGLTALIKLENVEKRWDWTAKEPTKTEWHKLLMFAKSKFNYSQEPYASLGPGACLPRAFLEKYGSIEVPELCHDELRLPLFGQIFGFKLFDTGFYKKWFSENERRFFNCKNKEIVLSVISEEMNALSGRRVFHPFRKIFSLQKSFKSRDGKNKFGKAYKT